MRTYVNLAYKNEKTVIKDLKFLYTLKLAKIVSIAPFVLYWFSKAVKIEKIDKTLNRKDY